MAQDRLFETLLGLSISLFELSRRDNLRFSVLLKKVDRKADETTVK
jgi:hypothetical protein